MKDTVDLYLEEINRIPLLTIEQEKQLGREIKNGDKFAINKMVELTDAVCRLRCNGIRIHMAMKIDKVHSFASNQENLWHIIAHLMQIASVVAKWRKIGYNR